MKNYIFTLIAILLATICGVSTKPIEMFATAKFRYVGSTYSCPDVATLSNWVYDATPFACPGDFGKACGIIVDEKYYHLEEGLPVLNASPSDFDDANDEVMVIVAEQGICGPGICRVSSSGTTAVSIDNRGCD